MRAVGTKENIEEFIKVMNAGYDYGTMEFDYDRHMFRVFEAVSDEIDEYDDGVFAVTINGYCAWSVRSCMFDDGYYGRIKERYSDDFRGTTLLLESKKLGLNIEVFSEESGMCFQEHCMIDKGEVVIDECIDYEEHYIGDFDTIEEYNEEYGTNFTEDMIQDEEYIYIGGYGDEYGNFKNIVIENLKGE
jgi:hypothetical protein